MVTFDEFKKLEIKTAKILEVDDHPDADKLYVVKVDLGGEQRQVVAGIKPSYSKEELVGMTVAVVANLEPATIRGVESAGMILAATDENGISVLTCHKPVAPGTIVK